MKDKKEIFETQISPLVNEIKNICNDNDMDFISMVEANNGDVIVSATVKRLKSLKLSILVATIYNQKSAFGIILYVIRFLMGFTANITTKYEKDNSGKITQKVIAKK